MLHATLPQLERLFLTDAGLETDMVFNHGLDLPCFASITLLRSTTGSKTLERYFRDFLELGRRAGTGIILESATWRASPDWTGPLGMTQDELDLLNQRAITMLLALREEYRSAELPIVVSGCLGPRGDGYEVGIAMSADEAAEYHSHQAEVLTASGADMLSAITMTNINEAVGIARAARGAGLPVAISFTVETDGRLPAGDQLGEAILATDSATDDYPAYYMVNCAHPTHFAEILLEGGDWVGRVSGLRANASRCSHAELDAMTTLDDGDPVELGEEYRALRERLPQLKVLGGCCGTDIRHVAAIAKACAPQPAAT